MQEKFRGRFPKIVRNEGRERERKSDKERGKDKKLEREIEEDRAQKEEEERLNGRKKISEGAKWI